MSFSKVLMAMVHVVLSARVGLNSSPLLQHRKIILQHCQGRFWSMSAVYTHVSAYRVQNLEQQQSFLDRFLPLSVPTLNVGGC